MVSLSSSLRGISRQVLRQGSDLELLVRFVAVHQRVNAEVRAFLLRDKFIVILLKLAVGCRRINAWFLNFPAIGGAAL